MTVEEIVAQEKERNKRMQEFNHNVYLAIYGGQK